MLITKQAFLTHIHIILISFSLSSQKSLNSLKNGFVTFFNEFKILFILYDRISLQNIYWLVYMFFS